MKYYFNNYLVIDGQELAEKQKYYCCTFINYINFQRKHQSAKYLLSSNKHQIS